MATPATTVTVPFNFRAQNAEVYYFAEPVVTVGEDELGFLKRQAAVNPRLRSKLCAHPDTEAAVHEMLMVHHRSVYGRPHSHTGKSESLHIIEGEASVVLLDAQGAITNVIKMGAAGSGRVFYYRVPDHVYHGLIIESEWLIFHETTDGPFDPSRTHAASWAPDGNDAGEAERYMHDLEARAIAFRRS